jgi:Ca2+:H+ antiporter
MVFSLKTHRELFAAAEHGEDGDAPWPIGLALATLAGVTVLVALVSEVFVESVQEAAKAFGMTPAFVGFIIVALVGGGAEMASAFSGARKNRLDLSVGIALGSASQIALFVAPLLVLLSYLIGPTPMFCLAAPALCTLAGEEDGNRVEVGAGQPAHPVVRMILAGVAEDRRAGHHALPELLRERG